MGNFKKTIETKDKKREKKEIDNVALWTVLTASFSIYLYNTNENYSRVEDKEIQKEYLSWFLLKKISETLINTEINFDCLIITFLNSHYCDEDSFLNNHDPFLKEKWELIKEKSKILKYISTNDHVKVVIPNFYIPVRNKKIINLEANLRKMKDEFEKKWKFSISSILFQGFSYSDYSVFGSTFKKDD